MPELLVIGGGIIGRAVAWRAAEAGRSVQWCAGDTSSGSASAAAGAMLSVASEVSAAHEERARDLDVGYRHVGRKRWDEWLPQLAEEAGIDLRVVAGTFVVANALGDDDAAELAAIRRASHRAGLRVESIAPEEVPGLEPDRGARPHDALYLPDEATVDAGRLLDALGAVLQERTKVDVIREEVTRLEVDEQQVVARCATGRVLSAEHVVLATGATTGALLAASDLDDLVPPVLGGRGVSAMVRMPAPIATCIRTPNRAFACGLHVVPRADGLTYVGATNRLSTSPDLDRAPTAGELVTLLRSATRELLGGLRNAEVLGVAVGHRPVTLDHRPLVGRTGDPRVLVATGTWRNGIGLAPVIAEMIVEELDRPASTASHPYSTARPMPETALDAGALRRGARGIIAGLVDAGALEAGRSGDLDAFVEHALSSILGQGDERMDRALARLVGRAPIEEVLPLVFDAIARQRR